MKDRYIDPEWFATFEADAKDVISGLCRELSDAYEGVNTLPADHPAAVMFRRGIEFLMRIKAKNEK